MNHPSSMRTFFTIWPTQVLSWLGSELVQFALIWWLTKTTGSATVLALSTTMVVLPRIFIGPFAGPLVDRLNRRWMMISADVSIALATVVLAVLYAAGGVQIGYIYALMFIRATGGVFHLPAMMASVTAMIPEKHLDRIAGMNSALGGLVMIIAPPLGALLLDVLPMQGILAIDVTTAALAVGTLLFVRIPQPAHTDAAQDTLVKTVLVDLQEGLRYVWNWRGLRALFAILIIMNLLQWPVGALGPILVTEHFGGHAFELAWFQSAMGIGGIIGGIVLVAWGGFRRRIVTVTVTAILLGATNVWMGLTPSSLFGVAIGGAFVGGGMSAIANASSIALFQAIIPPDKQGRVLAIMWSVISWAIPIGLLTAGPIADAINPQVWYVFAGAGMILMCGVVFLTPCVMHLEDKEQPRESPAEVLVGVEQPA